MIAAHNRVDSTGQRDYGTAESGIIGRIPIRNIWFLMLYAPELYRDLPKARNVGVEDNPDKLLNLAAEHLTGAMERRRRRNFNFGYQRAQSDLGCVRGRIDIFRTERHQLLQRGRVACSFDELTVDTPINRFVKAALDMLGRVVCDRDLAHRCRTESARMARAGVTGDPASSHRRRPLIPVSQIERIGRIGEDDRLMLAAARLAFDLTLPTEDAGAHRLAMSHVEDDWAWKLFERAVGGLYEAVLSRKGWHVSRGEWLRWQVDARSSGMDVILPWMETDIVLERPISYDSAAGRHKIVVDTKFKPILQPGRNKQPKLDSANIYQIYAYLRSQERSDDPRSLDAEGMLLYPSVYKDYDEWALIQGHRIRFATVDLTADSGDIRRRLLEVVGASD